MLLGIRFITNGYEIIYRWTDRQYIVYTSNICWIITATDSHDGVICSSSRLTTARVRTDGQRNGQTDRQSIVYTSNICWIITATDSQDGVICSSSRLTTARVRTDGRNVIRWWTDRQFSIFRVMRLRSCEGVTLQRTSSSWGW